MNKIIFQERSSLYEIMDVEYEVNEHCPTDIKNTINDNFNDSLIGCLANDKVSYIKLYEALFKFSLQEKFKGKPLFHKKVTREFIKHSNHVEIKIKNKQITIAEFVKNFRWGEYLISINTIQQGSFYMLCKNGKIISNCIRKYLIDEAFVLNIQSIFIKNKYTTLVEDVKNYLDTLDNNGKVIVELFDIEMVDNSFNTEGKSIGDCSLRSISSFLNKSYIDVYKEMTELSIKVMKEDIDNTNKTFHCGYGNDKIIHRYLSELSPNISYIDLEEDNKYLSIISFMINNKKGKYLITSDSHILAYCDGKYYENFNSKYVKTENINYTLTKPIYKIYYDNSNNDLTITI